MLKPGNPKHYSFAEFHRFGSSEQSIHIGLERGPARGRAEDALPNEHRANHDVGSGEPVAEQLGACAEFAFDDRLRGLEIGPAALRQCLDLQ